MSKSNLGGCTPLDAPNADSAQPIRARLFELSQELGPEDYRGIAIPMVATLGSTGSQALVNYRVPTTHNLVINSIVGQLALGSVFQEILSIKNGSDATKGIGDFAAAPDVVGRLLLKAMNCQIGLSNIDRPQPLIDSGKLNLSSILTMTGGRPIDWSSAPHIVPAGESLQMDVSLVQSGTGDNAKLVGGDTQYGIVIIGLLIRVARS